MRQMTRTLRTLVAAISASMLAVGIPASAQELEAIDPDTAYSQENSGTIDGDLESASADAGQSVESETGNDLIAFGSAATQETQEAPPSEAGTVETEVATAETPTEPTFAGSETTYGQDDLIGAAEGVFGKGAEGLAGMIESLLREQGEPNAYIVGREGGGALVVGVRYGSGTLYHKVEGNRPVYWTGPSIGFDAGANAGNTFVLVYNLYDSEDLYKRFPAGEGQAYFVGGMHASYMRKGDVVLIPIRVGAGLRLGVNAGYMKFSKKQRWLPF